MLIEIFVIGCSIATVHSVLRVTNGSPIAFPSSLTYSSSGQRVKLDNNGSWEYFCNFSFKIEMNTVVLEQFLKKNTWISIVHSSTVSS